MRGLFGVESEFIQVGYDFDSLEARIESHYCYKWEEDVDKPYCKSLILEKPNDVHSRTAQKIAGIIQQSFERGSAKSVKYACLPVDTTEVLTTTGWKKYNDLQIGELVLTANTQGGFTEWKPIQRKLYYKDAETWTLKNKIVSLESTSDHKWWCSKRTMLGGKKSPTGSRFYKEQFLETNQINSETNIIHSLPYNSATSCLKDSDVALVAWLLSDGYYSWSEKSERTSASDGKRKGVVGVIAQAEHKYWKELEQVLEESKINYVKRLDTKNPNVVYKYHLRSKDLRDFLDKVVGSRLQKHDVNWCEWVLKLTKNQLELFLYHFWLADGCTTRSTTVIVQNKGNIFDAVCLAGHLTGKRVVVGTKTDICKLINIAKTNHTTGQRTELVPKRTTDVFCLTTENSTFVVKQNDFITITGNCSYGAQAPKVAKTIGCDITIGQLIFDGFWEAAKPLALLKEAVTKYWETTGKKTFVLGIDKRKIPTRSKHALVNSLFQSAGVICAKRAMVIHDRKLKEHGLLVDFFKDDWKTKQFCQQLIAYHKQNCGVK